MKEKYVGEDIKKVIRDIKVELDEKGKKLRAVYWVACGGSEAALNAGMYMMQSESKTLACGKFNSNLFVHAAPALLDDTCIVICCTLKGTAETIDAVHTAEKSGAHAIAMTGNADTEMAKAANCVITYNGNGIESNSTTTSVKIASEILHQFENYDKYDKVQAVFEHVNTIADTDRQHWMPAAVKFARDFENDKIFYVLGAGPLAGTAYSMAFCHFNEMQTLHAVLIPSGDYFHGPFETTTKELALIALMSNGRTRPLDTRVRSFFEKFARHYVLIDAKESEIWKVADPEIAEFFEPVALWPIERMFVEELSKVRKHPMTDRIYMWKYTY